MAIREKAKPEKVFTPKGKFVNEKMYVHRPELEAAFKKSLRKPKHIIIHGESGCGKTWLYKKLLNEREAYYQVLNAATINTKSSISDAIKLLVARIKPRKKDGVEDHKSATANAGLAKGELKNINKYSVSEIDPFLELAKEMNQKAGNDGSYLVIDNLEHIVNDEKLVKELSAIILYLDDDEYARYNVRIILVGTPSNLREYFSKVDSSQTIINRVQEIPEVSVLSPKETRSLASKGFFDILKLECVESKSGGFDRNYLLNAISWFSTNVPQYIHEICLEIALAAEENENKITDELYISSLRCWVQDALVSENSSRLLKNSDFTVKMTF